MLRHISFEIFDSTAPTPHVVRTADFIQPVIKIGRVKSAHLVLDDESVAQMHAIIEAYGDVVEIIDLGSTYGTYVNGKKQTKATLHPGDKLALGNVRMMIEIEHVEAPPVSSEGDWFAGMQTDRPWVERQPPKTPTEMLLAGGIVDSAAPEMQEALRAVEAAARAITNDDLVAYIKLYVEKIPTLQTSDLMGIIFSPDNIVKAIETFGVDRETKQVASVWILMSAANEINRRIPVPG